MRVSVLKGFARHGVRLALLIVSLVGAVSGLSCSGGRPPRLSPAHTRPLSPAAAPANVTPPAVARAISGERLNAPKRWKP